MKKILPLRLARLLRLRNVFVLSLFVSFCFVISASMNGCSSGPTSPGTTAGLQVTTIYGRVTDETGAPMTGVTVSGGSKSALTDANGLFIIKDATVPQGRAVIIAKKTGYFDAARAEAPNSNGTTRMALSMMSNAVTASVPGTSGGTVNAGSASVKFAAGSFTDGSGNTYTGKVSVSARFLDPASPTFYSFFSGDEQAQRTDGSTTNLVSCGVLRVELHDQNGQPLKLDPTKPATLTCPKPADPKAPATIQLWSFDETLGEWKEEGTATLQGNNYVGTVTHFTDYNFDYCGIDNGTLQFRIVCNTAPIGGVVAEVLGRTVTTGPDGIVSIRRVAADGRPVTVDVKASDNGGLYYLNTPKAVTVVKDQLNNAGDIILDSPCPAELSGSLICGDAFVEGLVIVSDGKNISYVYSKDGKWAIQAPAGVPLTVDATDPNGNQASTVSVLPLASGEQRNIGNIGLCGNGTVTYIDITTSSNANQNGELIGLSPDGSHLAAFITPQLTVYDTKTGNVVSQGNISSTKQYYYGGTLEFSMDNSKVLLSSNYGGAEYFNVSGATATSITVLSTVSGAKLYDDGSKIIGMQSSSYPNPPTVNVYSGSDGSILKTLHPQITNSNDSVGSFGFIHDEESIIYPDSKSSLAHVWGVSTDAELRNFGITGYTYTFTSSEDGLTVASSSDYQIYDCYDSKAGTKSGSVNLGTNSRYGSILLTKNFGYTSDQVSGAEVIRITKISDGSSTIKLLPGTSTASSIAASRNEQYLAAATNGKIRIWKLQ